MGSGSGLACAIRLNSVLSSEEKRLYQDPEDVRRVLGTIRTIAIVGLSNDRQKASYMVGSYLQAAGYRIVPIHPKADTILGQKVYRRLADVPLRIDAVDVFRPAIESSQLAQEAIAIGARVFWQQLRIVNGEAAALAREAGLISIMDLCLKMEHGRYSGGLQTAGMNTEIISARRISSQLHKENDI